MGYIKNMAGGMAPGNKQKRGFKMTNTYTPQHRNVVISRAKALCAQIVAAQAAPDVYAAARAIRGKDPIYGRTWNDSLRRAAQLRRETPGLPPYRIETFVHGYDRRAATGLYVRTAAAQCSSMPGYMLWSYVDRVAS